MEKHVYLSVFDRLRRLEFLVVVIGIVALMGIAVATMAKGSLVYYNHYGLAVFAPFTIAIGLALVILGLLHWKKLK